MATLYATHCDTMVCGIGRTEAAAHANGRTCVGDDYDPDQFEVSPVCPCRECRRPFPDWRSWGFSPDGRIESKRCYRAEARGDR